MKIIKAVHINGTDKRKRYWKVPEHLQDVKLKVGDEAAVMTVNGFERVRIIAVTNSPDRIFYWKNKAKGKSGQFEVTQEVIAFFDRNTKEVKIKKNDKKRPII